MSSQCRQRASATVAGTWRWQHKTELDADKWSVVYTALGEMIDR